MWIWHEIVRSRVSILLFPVIFWKYLETKMNTAIWLIYCILRSNFYGILNHTRPGSDPFCLFLFFTRSSFFYVSFVVFLSNVIYMFCFFKNNPPDSCRYLLALLIKEHILQLTSRKNALVIHHRAKLSLNILVQVSTCGLYIHTTRVDISVSNSFIVTMARSVWLFLYLE